MEGEEDKSRPKGQDNHRWTNRRTWGKRLSGQVQYERWSALDAGGRPRIFFRLTPPPGQDQVDPAIWSIMEEHRKDTDGYPTNLKYTKDRIHGKTWNIEDTERGRAIANRIDMALESLAEQLEQGGNAR